MPSRNPSRTTPSRKKQHVNITLTKDVRFRTKTTGLEHLEFVHNALPEVHFSEIDTTTSFLGRKLNLPMMVSCMTGGYADALTINRELAEVAQEIGIAMGVGSQRQALEDKTYHRTFSVVREAAPDIPIVGNIGASEVARMESVDSIQRLVDLIKADAFAVHLNPLQEFLQPEGNTDFRGVLTGIGRLVNGLSVPVIVKEIGAGISAEVARRLLEMGVTHIDIAGAGGTSWAGVETLRRKDRGFGTQFWDWGIPTARAIRDVVQLKGNNVQFTLIASGGIISGIDAAKCIALGADLVASARPLLLAWKKDGRKGVHTLLNRWRQELKGVMFLTGSSSITALQRAPLVSYGAA
ncbi:MAG: Isopentenyl-diphosphate delta-isomerase [Bacteroidetes bacterium]|nr:Isopentenyl-diphosphate delta-isomerase [Bacteroidota bacterium]